MSIASKVMDPERTAASLESARIVAQSWRAEHDPDVEEPDDCPDGHDASDLAGWLWDALALADHWEAEAYELGERLKATRADLAKARATVDDVTHVANMAQEKAAGYRDRCPVAAEDVEAAGVTYAHLDAWAEANELTPAHAMDWPAHKRTGRSDIGWVTSGEVFHGSAAGWPGNRGWGSAAKDIADFIMFAAKLLGRAAFDILDEMAAMDPA